MKLSGPPVLARLVPVTGAAWLAAWATVSGALPCTAAWVVGMWLAAAGLVGMAMVASLNSLPRGWLPVTACAAVAVAAAVTSGALQLAALRSPPWPEWAQRRTQVHVTAVVTSWSRRLETPGGVAGVPTQQEAVARVRLACDSAGTCWHDAGTVALRGPTGESLWRRGDVISGPMRVRTGDPSSRDVAQLTAVDPPNVAGNSLGWAGALPRNLRQVLGRAAGTGDAALALGMVVGDDSDLPSSDRAALRTAGLSHLTAVSGANLAIVAGVALAACRVAGVGPKVAAALAACCMGCFVLVAGPEPSVLRAAAMAAVALGGVVVGGGKAAVSLQVAALVLLVADPWLAVERGFALSCAATAGLVAVGAWVRTPQRTDRPTRRWVALGSATAAGMATAPLLASYGQGVSWISIPTNVLVTPLIPVVTLTGLAAGVVAGASMGLAAVPAWAATHAAALILAVGRGASTVSGGSLPWPAGVVGGLAAAVWMAGAVWLARRSLRLALAVGAGLAVAALASARIPGLMAPAVPPDWQMVVCDVGQGDATVIRSGPNSAVLVDAGPTPGGATDCVRRSGVKRLDAVIVTHAHSDHTSGLPQVLSAFSPGLVVTSGSMAAEAVTAEAVTAAAAAAPPLPTVRTARLGEVVDVGVTRFSVVAAGGVQGLAVDENAASLGLVVATSAGGPEVRAFLGADLGPDGQRAALGRMAGPVDVVKIPHHGSPNQAPELAAESGASVAVISCGSGNLYGHPAPATVEAWQATGAAVLRTDTQGDVIVSGGSGALTTVTRATGARWRSSRAGMLLPWVRPLG